MSMVDKRKRADVVKDVEVKNFYKENGTEYKGAEDYSQGYRFDTEKVYLQTPGSEKVGSNMVTYSQPSSEILVLVKVDEKWHLALAKQARTPYKVEVDGKIYFKTFLEQAAGLVEEAKGQDFVSAAIAETKQELGAQGFVYMKELVAPRICRHVSYADEMSKLYLAVITRLGEQNLDPNENIKKLIVPLDEAKEEFMNYLEGKSLFFGYEVPDITMLSMTSLFWQLDTGRLDLDNLPEKENLLK